MCIYHADTWGMYLNVLNSLEIEDYFDNGYVFRAYLQLVLLVAVPQKGWANIWKEQIPSSL